MSDELIRSLNGRLRAAEQELEIWRARADRETLKEVSLLMLEKEAELRPKVDPKFAANFEKIFGGGNG